MNSDKLFCLCVLLSLMPDMTAAEVMALIESIVG